MSHEPMDADLPRCPHGNEAVIRSTVRMDTAPNFVWIDNYSNCPCTVMSDTEPRARRAWLALCAEQPE